MSMLYIGFDTVTKDVYIYRKVESNFFAAFEKCNNFNSSVTVIIAVQLTKIF